MPSGPKNLGVAPRDLATAADASGIHANINLVPLSLSLGYCGASEASKAFIVAFPSHPSLSHT
jgi:hypothetical protein